MVHLGCYGDVLRVKILYNKKDSALIQFAESFQAQTGLYNDVQYIMVYQLNMNLHVLYKQ